MNTYTQVGDIKSQNQLVFLQPVFICWKKMQPISSRGPILEVHPVGQGSALNTVPMHMNKNKQALLQVRQRALPPLPIWQCSVALSSRLWVGGSFRLLGQRTLLHQLFFILPKRMAVGQMEACSGTELASRHGRTAPSTTFISVWKICHTI